MFNLKEKFNYSSVLAPLLTLYTLTYLGLMIYDFVAKAKFDMPTGMMPVYIALVGAYAADKEIKRWTGKEEPPKSGSFFVYCWLIFFLLAFVVSSFWKEFILPNDATAVTLQVLGIFFGSKASKKIYESKTGSGEEVLTREQTVLAMLKENGKVQRKDVMAKLALSDSTVGRLLDKMEKSGTLTQVGKFKDAYYILVQQSTKDD